MHRGFAFLPANTRLPPRLRRPLGRHHLHNTSTTLYDRRAQVPLPCWCECTSAGAAGRRLSVRRVGSGGTAVPRVSPAGTPPDLPGLFCQLLGSSPCHVCVLLGSGACGVGPARAALVVCLRTTARHPVGCPSWPCAALPPNYHAPKVHLLLPLCWPLAACGGCRDALSGPLPARSCGL